MTDREESAVYCPGCQRDVPESSWDHGEWVCCDCVRERDEHPAWLAIQRVERGEATVRRRADLGGVYHFGYYWLETSDGWRFNVYSRGEPFYDWRYVEAVVAPDGTRYEADYDDAPPPLRLPYLLWCNWSPDDSRRWALLPAMWSYKPGALDRVTAGGEP
jgi:predicted Fe-S protein YdhL (DUF1289 family)